MLQRDKTPQIENIVVRNAYENKDCSLSYARWSPDGAPRGTVVAVHGLTRQKRDFDYIGRFLADHGYDVIAVDAPGRGDSGWLENPDDYSALVYADIFSAFLRQMKLARVHWLGTSMGGLIALLMALKGDGEYFQSLILNDITHKPNPAALKRLAGYMSETFPVFTSISQYETLLRQNLPLGPVPESVWQHYATHQLRPVEGGFTFHFDPKLVRRAMIDLNAEVDLGAAYEFIRCPIALVAGGVSDLCTPVEIAELQRLVPRAKVHVVAGAGHVPALADDASQQFILEQIQASAPRNS